MKEKEKWYLNRWRRISDQKKERSESEHCVRDRKRGS
nr:MAG TPA: hypothetical protein [Caudoviricetes sp.]